MTEVTFTDTAHAAVSLTNFIADHACSDFEAQQRVLALAILIQGTAQHPEIARPEVFALIDEAATFERQHTAQADDADEMGAKISDSVALVQQMLGEGLASLGLTP